ncbi:MAG: DNA polymerase III subunit epsilon [Gammaproteobacteria bacterium]|nr:DNA polymerase III subunit epsilon [Gammaproteobacteria bacterium]
MRQVVLDTETTGLQVEDGHRVIEIGCVEIVNRRRTGRTFHQLVNPERDIDAAAEQVHGLSREALAAKPRFVEIAPALVEFLGGAELLIHNAEFDLGFLANEFQRAGFDGAILKSGCGIVDTLALARRMHPGQRNGLDALCKRYGVDNSGRDLHGALLDAQLLADVYLVMTGGQATLSLDGVGTSAGSGGQDNNPVFFDRTGISLSVIRASDEELADHERILDLLDQHCKDKALWRTAGVA